MELEAAAVTIHQKEQSRIFRCQDHNQKRHQIYRGVARLMKYTACTRLFDATYDLIGKRYWPPNGKRVGFKSTAQRRKEKQAKKRAKNTRKR